MCRALTEGIEVSAHRWPRRRLRLLGYSSMPTYRVPLRASIEVALTLDVEDIDSEHAMVLASRVIDGLSVNTEDVLGQGGKLEADIEVGDTWIGEPQMVASSAEGDDGDPVGEALTARRSAPRQHAGVIQRDQYRSE